METLIRPVRLIDYFWLMVRARFWILGSMIFGALVMFGASKVLTKEYTSVVSFVSVAKAAGGGSSSSNSSDIEKLSQVLNMNSGTSGSSGNNLFYIAIMQSARIRDAVAAQAHLGAALHLPSDKAARGWLARHTVFREIKGGVVEVKVSAYEPQTAFDLATGYLDQLNQVLNTVTLTQSQIQVNFLQERVAAIQKEMSDAKNEQTFKVKEMIELTLMRELELARANAARERMDVTSLDTPEISSFPSFPDSKQFVAIGFALGLILGLIGVLVASGFRNLKADPYNQQRLLEIQSWVWPLGRRR